MKTGQAYTFTPARNAMLRWFTEPGADVSAQVRSTLLGELFGSPAAVAMGVFAGLIVNGYALFIHCGSIFLVLMLLDAVLALTRVIVARRVSSAAMRGLPVATDFALTTAFLWCCAQGAMGFAAVRSGEPSLQLLGGATVVSLIGPICARNYAAPRWAFLLIGVTYLPFLVGALSTNEPWTWLFLVQCGPFLLGTLAIVRRFQALAIDNLVARYESQHSASHDTLTGLLNRAGLMERLTGLDQEACRPFTLFYLDLDGFKAVNDTLGHPVGDQLLCDVAARIRTRTAPADVVGRLGGDEFVIACPGFGPSDAPGFAETIICEIARPYDFDPQGVVRVGVSVGFACFPEDATSLTELHWMADTALYTSKGNGKGTHRRFDKSRSRDDAAPPEITLSAAA